ncbi:putative Flap endonuclease 1 [Blattamonas nauphoetae]|uniref:Flap endonuclease 1 n=1 Tax=Blattamonas nauphoetae TaxID=2049346 RepID=A0ABQ9YMK0_9EUKA|nr:putative Flap endonuclease 1 [Blattamonas nauphoetae]
MKILAEHAPNAIKETEIKNYFNRIIAIDASMALYQFLIAVRMEGGQQLTNAEGEVTSHLQGLFNRTIRLMEKGLKPVYVFDGKPPENKDGTLLSRKIVRDEAKEKESEAREEEDVAAQEKYARRSVRVTQQHNDEAKRLLSLMGVPFVEAAGEAEAQCAYLSRQGKVWAVGSEDMDSLTFGAKILLRNLTFSEARKLPIKEISLNVALEGLGLTMDEFIDMCILCGCDYVQPIKGVGEKKAYELIQKFHNLEAVLDHLREKDPEGKRFQIPVIYPVDKLRDLFKNPEVNTEIQDKDIQWTAPNEQGLIDFLVKEKAFDENRVKNSVQRLRDSKKLSSQGRLDMFFRPAPRTETKVEKKQTPTVALPKGKLKKGLPTKPEPQPKAKPVKKMISHKPGISSRPSATSKPAPAEPPPFVRPEQSGPQKRTRLDVLSDDDDDSELDANLAKSLKNVVSHDDDDEESNEDVMEILTKEPAEKIPEKPSVKAAPKPKRLQRITSDDSSEDD